MAANRDTWTIGPEDQATDLIVFSHPNHEVAVFGLLQRTRPAMIYLTDGGGAERVAQTQDGLRSIGLLDRATFLDHTEASFYQALLDRDLSFFVGVSDRVAESLDRWRPARVLCDAVEYYNPVHDLSLPLLLRALASPRSAACADAAVFELPLIHQVASSGGETYAVQRPIPSRAASALEFHLNERELAAKQRARDQVYTLLKEQLGPVIANLDDVALATEMVLPAMPPVDRPADCVVRYEWRAALLEGQGLIERAITYAEHFLPVARALAGDWRPRSGAASNAALS